MDVVCEKCGTKLSSSLGDMLVAGWAQKNPERTPGRRGWLCPACAPDVAIPEAPSPDKTDKRR